MSYYGDFKKDQFLDFTFTTRDSTGLPSALSGIPTLEAYKGSGITPTSQGITLATDFSGVSGLNHVHIETSGAFYEIINDYNVVIVSGVVDGTAVGGETLGTFSMENRFDEVDIVKINGNVNAATSLEATQASGIIRGSASGTPTTTSMPTDLTETTDDHFNDAGVVWLTGVLAGQRKPITGYIGASRTVLYKQTTDAPSSGDEFEIV